MSKIGVIYWSQTGNTETMANAVAEGAKAAGHEVELLNVADTNASQALAFDALALGCPAMGMEVLEEAEFEPFFADIESGLSGKKVLLFGSYDWGDGQWMRDWADRVKAAGAELVGGEGLIAQLEPDDEALSKLKELAASL
ncbi:flavodoxin [Peptoniphilaceae bacterium SGI.131]